MVRRKHELKEAKVGETVGRNNCLQEFGRGKAPKWVFGPDVVSSLGGLTGNSRIHRVSLPIKDDKMVSREENEPGILTYGSADEKEVIRGVPASACRRRGGMATATKTAN